MKETRFFYVPNAGKLTELPLDEAMHALRVLRLKSGDEMFLMDGSGTFYKAEVTIAATKRCMYRIIGTLPQEKNWRGHLHLAVAPTKMMDRIEWLCEKATEVGVDEFSFLNCKFSERKVMRTVRWKPQLNSLISFKDFIDTPRVGLKFIAHCYDEVKRIDFFDAIYNSEKSKSISDITVLIGPEGDFSIDEVKYAINNGYISVSLGNSRLRTETAALSAVLMGHLALRK